MAITRNDKLEKALSGINTDSRFTTWLWAYLNNILQFPNLGDFGSFGMRDRMADAITKNPWAKQRIQIDRTGFLVAQESLSWIKNDKRQCHWITRKIAERNGFNYITGMKNLNYQELAIATIDIWNIPIPDKSLTVAAIASEWNTQEKSDKIFEWFYGPDEQSKLELTWEIASKLYPIITTFKTPWQDPTEMILSLDILTIADKKILVDSLKKRWSHNKYRANTKEKKQCNLILTKKSIDRLQKLANKHELKRAQVLEILLQMEEEKGIYISERLKVLNGI